MRRFLLGAGVFLTLATATPAHAGGPPMLVGTAEDLVKRPTILEAKAELDLLRLAGFDSVRVTSIWDPGEESPVPSELAQLRALSDAAALTGIEIFVAVYPFGSRTTPLTEQAQSEFAAYAASIPKAIPGLRRIIVGNEPNLNRFWLPQFGPNGENAAAVSYTSLLARTFDRLKAVSQQITVIGGALSPRGSDRPGTARDTHSPTKFIRDMGTAYRAMGRTSPIMDWFAIHPYPDNSSQPPGTQHPNTTTIGIGDYAKLVALLGEAFDGTAQLGSTLPVLYAEFGIETVIPPAKASIYSGSEPATIKPVDEQTQGRYYQEAIALAFCQPNVVGLFVFHAFDEPQLDRFQSGVYYADKKPKASRRPLAQAARDSRGGVVAHCDGLALTPTAAVRYPTPTSLANGTASIQLTCDVDCTIYARLERLPRGSVTFAAYARGSGGVPMTVAFPERRVSPGRYLVRVSLRAPVNPGPPRRLESRELIVLARK